MKIGVELRHNEFLSLALDGSEWLASRPGLFSPVKEPPSAIEEKAVQIIKHLIT
jgi:hypothetical protein